MKKLTLIVCLDVNNGIRFNNRRQSRDRVVIEDILRELTTNIWMLNETKKLFLDYFDTIENNELDIDKKVLNNIKIDNDWFNKIGSNDICFLEDKITDDVIDMFEKIVVYRWDRVYPYDSYVDMDKYKLIEIKELKGYSHKVIKKEIYIK